MPLPSPKFKQGEAWDGTTPHSRPTTDVFKRVDGEIGNRLSAEIIALEQLLKDVISTIGLLQNPGEANSLLGVKSNQSGLEYKTLVQGDGILISSASDSITFTATGEGVNGVAGVAGEPINTGDVLYISLTDGKVYKAQANTEATSKVIGCSGEIANPDDTITIFPNGIVTNTNWSLIIGKTYYLSPYIAGSYIATAPQITGQYLVPIGVATGTTQLAVNLRTRILM